MSAGPLGGYSGFRSRTTELYAYEPGVSGQQRTRKYGQLRQESSSMNTRPYVGPAPHQASETTARTRNVRSQDYHPPIRGGVLAGNNKRLPMEKPFLHQSIAQYTSTHLGKEVSQLSRLSDEDLEKVFHIVDTDDSGSIDPGELRALLFELLGNEPTDHQIRIFSAHCEPDDNGTISYSAWKTGAREAIRHVLGVAGKSLQKFEQPWIKHRDRSKEVLGDPRRATSYKADIGAYGEDPRNRGVMNHTGKVLNSTTNDISEGTTKRSSHIPGYTGFIPKAENTAAFNQGKGDIPHDTFHDHTNLSVTFTKRVPRFSGFVPETAGKEVIDVRKPGGLFAPTEQAAADSLVEDYWKARQRR